MSKSPHRVLKIDISNHAPNENNGGTEGIGREGSKEGDKQHITAEVKKGLCNPSYWYTIPLPEGLDLDSPEQIWGQSYTGLYFPVHKKKSTFKIKAR